MYRSFTPVRQRAAGFQAGGANLQLPFALVQVLLFTTRRKHLGAMAFGRKASIALWAAAAVVIVLNAWMLQLLSTT